MSVVTQPINTSLRDVSYLIYISPLLGRSDLMNALCFMAGKPEEDI